jgi:HK97 family phage prohead protease
VPLIDHHRYGSAFDVLGKMVEAEETDEGLSARFEVVPGEDGDRLLSRIKGGFVNGLSIGYEAGRYDYEDVDRGDGVKSRVRHLREVKLYEVSAVIWGMNPAALIDTNTVKALLGGLSPEEKDELRALLLSDTAPAPAAVPAADDGPAHDVYASTDALRLKLRLLKLRPAGYTNGKP